MIDIFGAYRLKELLEKRLSKEAMKIVKEELAKLEQEFDKEMDEIAKDIFGEWK